MTKCLRCLSRDFLTDHQLVTIVQDVVLPNGIVDFGRGVQNRCAGVTEYYLTDTVHLG